METATRVPACDLRLPVFLAFLFEHIATCRKHQVMATAKYNPPS